MLSLDSPSVPFTDCSSPFVYFLDGTCSLKSSSGPGATTAAPAGPTPQMPRLAGGQGGGPDGQGVMLGDSSWLASLATGAAPPGPALRASPLAPLLLGVGGLLLVL